MRRGLEGLDVKRAQAEAPPPRFWGPSDAPAVGVVAGGLGSQSLVEATLSLGSYRAAVVEGISVSALAACDAVILPERINPKSLTKDQCWLMWDYVGEGGLLVLTHDAVGYRSHPVLFPWVCSGGTAHVETPEVDVVWAADGHEPAGKVRLSYPEHILLQPCIRAEMTPIALDPETEKPTVTGAIFDTGKVVACGIALGAVPHASNAPLTEGEKCLLQSILDWLVL